FWTRREHSPGMPKNATTIPRLSSCAVKPLASAIRIPGAFILGWLGKGDASIPFPCGRKRRFLHERDQTCLPSQVLPDHRATPGACADDGVLPLGVQSGPRQEDDGLPRSGATSLLWRPLSAPPPLENAGRDGLAFRSLVGAASTEPAPSGSSL